MPTEAEMKADLFRVRTELKDLRQELGHFQKNIEAKITQLIAQQQDLANLVGIMVDRVYSPPQAPITNKEDAMKQLQILVDRKKLLDREGLK